MGLYKYVTAKTALRILNGSIKFTQPGAFNDPFELLPQFLVSPSTHESRLELSFCVVSPKRKGLDKGARYRLEDHGSDINARKIVSLLNQQVGILCLTRNRQSLLMWAHYAEEYGGAIIEFDEGHEFFRGLNPVRYQKHRPVYDLNDFTSSPVPIADLCVKPDVWRYEKEVRLARPIAACNVRTSENGKLPIVTMDLPIECVSSVYMGERMQLCDQRKIWDLVKDTHITLSLSAVANWEYSFRYDHIKLKGTLATAPILTPRTAAIFSEEPGQLGEFARWMMTKHPMAEFANHRC